MLFRWIRSSLERRAALRQKADALIAAHGEDGWDIARTQAFAFETGTPEFHAAWAVGKIIEHKLKIDHMPDTATRYLERRP